MSGIWLDSQLTFTSHINRKVKRVFNNKIQIKDLTKSSKLVSRLMW